MSQTKEHHIDIAVPLRGKGHVRIPEEVFMHRIHRLAGIALAVNITDIRRGMPYQQPDQSPAGIAGAAYYARSYRTHFTDSLILWKILLWLPKIFAKPFTSSPVHALF